MSILDDAIREHLELKRAHGADEAELKKLEDEAFGPPGRPGEPDPFSEAPTEFMVTPGAAEAAEPGEASGRRINIADLQEPPPPERAAEIQATRAPTPAAPHADEEDEEDEEFWSEQRLSDELDQALEAPLTEEHETPPRTDVHEIPAPVADPSAPVYDDAADDEEE